MVLQLGSVLETNVLGLKDHWIRHTRDWILDMPVPQQLWKFSCKWQCENPVFFLSGASWKLLLLPIPLR